MGPNCALEEFHVTGLDGEDLGFPDELSLKTIQMVIVPDEAILDEDFWDVDFNSRIKFESNQPLCGNWYFTYRSYFTTYYGMNDKVNANCPIKYGSAQICKFRSQDGQVFDHPIPIQDFKTRLVWDSTISED